MDVLAVNGIFFSMVAIHESGGTVRVGALVLGGRKLFVKKSEVLQNIRVGTPVVDVVEFMANLFELFEEDLLEKIVVGCLEKVQFPDVAQEDAQEVGYSDLTHPVLLLLVFVDLVIAFIEVAGLQAPPGECTFEEVT